MHIAPHFGIRYSNDLTDEFCEYIIDSVALLNSRLAPRGMSFFFNTVDVDQHIIGGKHCEDTFGWVVPDDAVDVIEPIRLAGEGEKLGDYVYACASWEDRGGLPHAVADSYLPGEAYE